MFTVKNIVDDGLSSPMIVVAVTLQVEEILGNDVCTRLWRCVVPVRTVRRVDISGRTALGPLVAAVVKQEGSAYFDEAGSRLCGDGVRACELASWVTTRVLRALTRAFDEGALVHKPHYINGEQYQHDCNNLPLGLPTKVDFNNTE